MAWNAHNGQPSALQPAAACLEHEGEGAAHFASSTRTGECDSQKAEWLSNLDARCQTGTRSHDRRWRPQPQAPRLDEGSSREDGPRLPRHMESLRNLMFRGAEEAPPASYFGGEGAAVPGICALPQQVMCSGGFAWRVRCLYARICRRRIYARGTRRPISFLPACALALCPAISSVYLRGAIQVAWRRMAPHRMHTLFS
jgi:hypothetical protein